MGIGTHLAPSDLRSALVVRQSSPDLPARRYAYCHALVRPIRRKQGRGSCNGRSRTTGRLSSRVANDGGRDSFALPCPPLAPWAPTSERRRRGSPFTTNR